MIQRFLHRIKNKWLYEFHRQFKPEIIGGFKRNDGTILSSTRISNVTHISHRENLFLEDHVFIGHFNYIDCFRRVFIGEGCQVTNFVSILTHSSHDALRLYGQQYVQEKEIKGLKSGEVTIGRYSYLGAHSLIMPGTKIGKGAIVSAYSYVEGDFPDYAILRGAPAQMVGSTKDRDEKLLKEFPELMQFYYNPELKKE